MRPGGPHAASPRGIERFGTRHRAALGITEDTDAVAVVVSEESGQMSVVERARIVRVPNETQLERALLGLLGAPNVPGGLGRGGRRAMHRPGRPRIARRRHTPEPAPVTAAPQTPTAGPASAAVPSDEQPDEGTAAAVGNR